MSHLYLFVTAIAVLAQCIMFFARNLTAVTSKTESRLKSFIAFMKWLRMAIAIFK